MTTQGWPFLIARGRRLGYRTLLAPEPLIADREYGILDDSVPPSHEQDRPDVIDVTTRSGRLLTVVHATHQVTAADLGDIEKPADEHGRPLQLLYGFALLRARIPEPRWEDLQKVLATALETYRRFLDDEESFAVETGRPFPLRSAPLPSALQAPAATPSAAAAARDGKNLAGPVGPAGLVALAVGVVVLVAVVVLVVLWSGEGQNEPLPGCSGGASATGSVCQPSPSR